MQFGDVIRGRFSCKVYDGRQISDEQLAAILEAGRAAPTAKNFQPQRIYVVQSKEGLAKLDGFTPCRYGAPTVLVVAYGRGAVLTYPDGAAGCRRASSGLVLQKGPASPGGFAGPLRCGPVSGAGARPRACRAGAGRGRSRRTAQVDRGAALRRGSLGRVSRRLAGWCVHGRGPVLGGGDVCVGGRIVGARLRGGAVDRVIGYLAWEPPASFASDVAGCLAISAASSAPAPASRRVRREA